MSIFAIVVFFFGCAEKTLVPKNRNVDRILANRVWFGSEVIYWCTAFVCKIKAGFLVDKSTLDANSRVV
jgi:hypothetical protein